MKNLRFIIVCTILVQVGASYICNTTSNIDPSKWPQLPDLPESFKTNIEINIVDQGSTMDVVEYFDNLGNRVALYTTKEGLDGVVVYDFPTNEVFYVTHGVCLVDKITARPEADLFGVTESDGRLHVMTSSTALKFGDQYNETYIGPDVIRGISVDHWRACLRWTSHNASFTVDYYFNKPNDWKTSSAFVSVPVRADVAGEYIHKDGSTKSIHHIYEYYAFTGSMEFSPTVFETPTGVICKGRQKTKPIPQFPKQFYYRQEIVIQDFVTFRDVWYDEIYKYARYDSRPIQPDSKHFYTTDPLTEILDYNTGVHFYRDNILGNCTILPLSKTSFGAKSGRATTNSSGFYMLDMQNPLELFYLDQGFTYVGQHPCRDMTCNVYSAIRRDIVVNGLNDTANTTIEIYFLDTDTVNYPDNGQDVPRVVPIRMTLEADSVGFSETINFYNYNDAAPDLSLFDVSSCYSDMAKLHFKVRFPGIVTKDRHKALLNKAQLKFAETMGIEITRIQNLRVDVDNADLFIHATLLDRTPTSAQFNYVGNLEVIDQGDMYIGNVLTPMQCADLCVAVTNFTCNSFDFCQNDPQRTCRLNRKHVSDGLQLKDSNTCGHFSRSVNGPTIPEMTILQAYQKLRLAVYSTKLQIQVEFDNQQMAYYIGVDTSIEFGSAKPTVMPKFTGQFSYHQEFIYPGQAQIFESQIWYDTAFMLVRYDYHNAKPEAPYYSTNPMTVIHDFNTGIQYTMDKYNQNCSITPINAGGFDSEIGNLQQYLYNKSYVVKMKNPLELFHTNIQTRYIGQRTVRNLLCDVFLGEIQDYSQPGLAGLHPAILQYYFLTDGWSEFGKDSGGVAQTVPVKLDITIVDKGLYYTYNFFDFEVQHPDLSIFDIQKCYSDQQKHRFQISFPGKFHPYLDIYQKVFIEETLLVISENSDLSVLRIQETRLDYDEDNIYFTATLMDKPPFLAYFTKTPGKVLPHKTNGFFINISTAKDCADACVQTNSFACNSFDICESVHYCFLSTEHIQDGQLITNDTTCDHYSRTVNATGTPSPDLYTAYINLKNDVFSGIMKVNIPIPTSNNKVITFTAESIRDTLVQDTTVPQGGRPLQSFNFFKNNVIYQNNDEVLKGVAIDDCAVSCLTEELFDCQSFEYCQSTEMCYLSRIQPDVNHTLVVKSPICNLYSRQYLSRYDKTPGTVYSVPGYKTLTGMQTDNLCAQQCTQRPECKSFDYCANTQTCQLRQTHKLDMPNNTMTQQATCNHYSRKYLDDFIQKYGRDMKIESSSEILGITADQCAKLCIEQESSNCKSFIFCGNQTVCQLKSMPPRQAPVVASQYCDLYTRKYFPGSQPPGPSCNGSQIPHPTIHPVQTVSTHTKSQSTQNTSPSNTQNNSSQVCSQQKQKVIKNSPGVLVGVAFGVFLPGLILGAIIMYFYGKYKTRSDDIHMNILNSNYDG